MSVAIDATGFGFLLDHASVIPSVASVVVERVGAPRFGPAMLEEYARAMRRRKPLPGRKEPYAESTVSDDLKHYRYLLAHACPVDFDDEASWHRHRDHRIDIEGKPEYITEDYRKSLRRLQKWRKVQWASLDEREPRATVRRELPTREVVARTLSADIKLGHFRYTNVLRKTAANFVQGTGARPPSEVAVVDLDDVKWTAHSGEVFTLRDFHDAAFSEDTVEVARLWQLAAQDDTASAVTIRQRKKRGKADEIRIARHAPAWALCGRNGHSLVNYVVHHRAKRARELGGIASSRLFVKWSGRAYEGKNPMKGCFARMRQVVVEKVWPGFTSYGLRGFHAREVQRATNNPRAAAAAIGDTVAAVERYYLGDPSEDLEGVRLKQPQRSRRRRA